MKKSFLRLMAVLGCSAMMMVACHSEKKVTTAPAPVNQPDTVVGVTIAVPITMEVKSAVSSNMKTQQKELIHALEIISYATDTEKDTMVTVEIIPDPNKLDAIKLGLNDSVLFKFNSAEINPKAEPVLNELAKKLNSFPET